MTDITAIPNNLPDEEVDKINEVISAFERFSDGKELQTIIYAGAYFLWAMIHEVEPQYRAAAMEDVADILFPDEEGVGTS